MLFIGSIVTTTLLLLSPLAASKACQPQNAVLPAPRAPHSSSAIQTAARALQAKLDDQLKSFQTSGISVGIKSIHDDRPLFDYHFTPKVSEDVGTDRIDAETIYRVGSVSKLIPVLAVLQLDGVSLDDSILKYLPELQGSSGDSIASTQWEDVTIRGLMSHMSGITTDTVFDLTLLRDAPWSSLGLPKLPANEGLTCAGVPGTKPCTIEDLISQLRQSAPTFAPYTTPSYSNSASPLLARVVEKITERRFNEVIKESIFDRAGMNSTSFDGYVDVFDKYGFVPKGDPLWNLTLGVYEPAGGMFSSTNDLLSLGAAILGNKLLSARKTRAWLQPDAFLPSFGQAIGGPWEIFRSDNLTSDKRIIDVYTKSGDVSMYHSFLALVPEYDLVISVMTGGVEVSRDIYARTRILSAAVSAFVPAMEQAAREEASSKNGQVGKYADNKTDSTLVLELDSGPGLRITQFTVRGFDVLGNIEKYRISTGNIGSDASSKRQVEVKQPKVEGRIYPSQRATKKESAWRAVFTFPRTPEAQKELERDVFYKDPSCDTWFGFDRVRYNFKSLTEFVFEASDDGKVESVSNPAFNVSLRKIDM